jgi:exodeoxyribonuclease V alpha subunit
MQTVEEALFKLSRSKFRSSFHLNKEDFDYINQKGIEAIESHCRDFVHTRLAPAVIPNDGKQTPMKGHPVFKAQHACACCCRGCLNKWYRVPKNTILSSMQEEKIVNLLMAWIRSEINANVGEQK